MAVVFEGPGDGFGHALIDEKRMCPRPCGFRLVAMQGSVNVFRREVGIFLDDSVCRMAVFVQLPDRLDSNPLSSGFAQTTCLSSA